MKVCAGVEGGNQVLVGRQVGQEPQLDLGVVAGKKHTPRRDREGRAHPVTQLGAGGDVLQVGIRAREAPRRGDGLVECGVNAAVLPDVGRKRIQVGALDLGPLAIVEHRLHPCILGCQVIEGLGVRGVEACLSLLEAKGGKPPHVKEDMRELLR